jgi:superfamily II DNA or RNA helicase
MVSYLLTETMRLRRELSLRSYDRLFPSQDTLPQGGFGNLIALPFQFEPRKLGNSLFVDDDFHAFPWEMQWHLLARVPRISQVRVRELSQVAFRTKRIVAAPAASIDTEEDDDARWRQQSAPSSPESTLPFAIPTVVRAVLAQRLFIEKDGLPSPLISRMRRLAAFQNPEFYKRQRLRLSTNQILRVIVCAEELPKYLALPRGCREEVQTLLKANGSSLLLDDQRNVSESVPTSFCGTLTDVQERAVRAMLDHDCGVLVAPPGSGKTVMGAYLTASRAVRTLVLVHRRPLLEQWVNQLAMFLDKSPSDIGQIGGGRSRTTGTLDVAMFQSLVRGEQVTEAIANYDQVIVDECHHVPAFSFERVLACVRARFIVGLTATPRRRDGHHPIGEMQLGPVRYVIDAKAQAAARPFGHKLIVRETPFGLPSETPRIQDVYKALTGDSERNEIIARDVAHVVEQGRSPIVLTERKYHLHRLAELIRGHCPRILVLQGGQGARRRLAEPDVPNDSWPRVIVAIGRYVGEGFDDPRLDTLFLTMPLSWKGTLIQYAGRIQRLHPAKREVRIYDYVDRAVPVLERMFRRRLVGYRSIGYVEAELPLGYGEVDDDFVLGRGWEGEDGGESGPPESGAP